MSEDQKFQTWAIIDLFGHTSYAGLVSEATIGGCSFLRLDVPPEEGKIGFTKFLGNGAIYSMSPCTEEVARAFIRRHAAAPITVYMPEIRRLEYAPGGMCVDQDKFMEERNDIDEDDPQY